MSYLLKIEAFHFVEIVEIAFEYEYISNDTVQWHSANHLSEQIEFRECREVHSALDSESDFDHANSRIGMHEFLLFEPTIGPAARLKSNNDAGDVIIKKKQDKWADRTFHPWQQSGEP